MLKKFSVEGGVVQSDYSVSSLSLLEIKKEKREIELDKKYEEDNELFDYLKIFYLSLFSFIFNFITILN